ncbi:MAG: cadherin-like beta sandwich domain-containing protein [Ruminococcus sp.]
MGKNLNKSELVKRTGKIAFFGIGAAMSHTFTRMEGFTDLKTSRGAKEFTRRYVDEEFDRTDVTGYSTSKSYAFDRHMGNPVHDDIINITENELTGQAAVREILVVDMTTVTEGNGKFYADAYRRQYAVVPDSDGDTTDCMTYSGTFKARGELEKIKVSSATSDWQTCYAGLDTDVPLLSNLTVTGAVFTEPSSFDSSKFYYQMTASSNNITIKPEITGNSSKMTYTVNGVNVSSLTGIKLNDGLNSVVILLDKGGVYSTYSITISYTAS